MSGRFNLFLVKFVNGVAWYCKRVYICTSKQRSNNATLKNQKVSTMTLTAQQAEIINAYIQTLRGKFIDSNVAAQKFPELQPVSDWSKNENRKFGAATLYCLFIDGNFSHQTDNYDDASDFLMDTENSQGFQFNYLQGLSVCADQN